jgi:hypothetical protein
MVHWEHRYVLGTMVFTIAGDVVRDFDDEYEAWYWLENDGWSLVAIEPPDPVRPGAHKYYFKRQQPSATARPSVVATQSSVFLTNREWSKQLWRNLAFGVRRLIQNV